MSAKPITWCANTSPELLQVVRAVVEDKNWTQPARTIEWSQMEKHPFSLMLGVIKYSPLCMYFQMDVEKFPGNTHRTQHPVFESLHFPTLKGTADIGKLRPAITLSNELWELVELLRDNPTFKQTFFNEENPRRRWPPQGEDGGR